MADPLSEDVAEAEWVLSIARSAPGGASDAETALYRRYAPRTRLYALRLLRDAQAAADFMQQVMLLTIEQLRCGKLRDPEKLGFFIFGMCRMMMLEQRRGAARRERLLEQYWPDLVALEPVDAARLDDGVIARCLERLSERERAVLVMTFYDDMPAQKVAIQLGLTAANVRVIRHRGLAHLRDCVNGGGDAR